MEIDRNEEGRPQSLMAHWHGQAGLASAFWLIGILGLVVFYPLYILLRSGPLGWLFLLLSAAYTIFAFVSIWRCAWNTSWKVWGYMARTCIVLLVPFELALLLLIANS